MYFQFACPGCQKNLKVREEKIGSKVRCPYCHHQMTVSSPEAPRQAPVETKTSSVPSISTESPVKQPPAANQEQWSDGTEVSLLKSALIGLAITAAFYVVVFPISLATSKLYVVELFCSRGWVPFVLVFLMSWSAAILYIKSRKLVRQKESMLFDLLPTDVSRDITPDTAEQFTKHVRSLPGNPAESFLINRVLRGLEHFRVLRNSSEVSSRLASQSEIDATSVESSYTILKVFIWAIPILGFIGTVIGISDAVGGFSGALSNAAEISELKESLNNVTGGLATAFDTTLIALVMSMLVMFPTSAMQKSEEDLLNWVDEYCNENLLKRLKGDDRAGVPASGEPRDMQKAIDAAMVSHHAELKTWTKKLESIGSTLTDEMAKGYADVDGKLQTQHAESLKRLDRAIQSVQKLTETINAGVDSQAQAMTAMAKQTSDVQDRLSGTMGQTADSLSSCFSGLEQGLTSLNGVLEKLGEKQVVIQAPPRRGWRLFGGRNGH